MKKTTLLLLILTALIGCNSSKSNNELYEEGVNYTLATFRKENYKDVKYDIKFSIPKNRDTRVEGSTTITFTLDKQNDIIIDFLADSSQVKSVMLNNSPVDYRVERQHIIIDREVVASGVQNIAIDFVSNDQSLNRRDDLLYTLLVPDRARTLLPCFDQPNIKALCSLELTIPKGWEAVANGKEMKRENQGESKIITFKESEPISSYLFAFTAGVMQRERYQHNGREISIYHRENEPKKVAQCPDIAREVFDALEWLEDYTLIDYPFAKYDLIIIPDFQYGGMEHTGATLYKASSMFLNENPTLNERLSRSSLIAHETAHMWFGDYVTMDWFSGVWIKEVFANYFASQIVEPQFPEINHNLNFMLDYYPSSYSEDRTKGTNPIDQTLENLNSAGLVYGQIIYNKSPIVMRNLIEYIGADNFQTGIQKYLKSYGYSNASWNDLIKIFDTITGKDISKWSDTWVNKRGMPTIEMTTEADSLVITQTDPFDRGVCWAQSFKVKIGNAIHEITINDKTTKVAINERGIIIPNVDGHGYGYFKLDNITTSDIYNYLDSAKDDINRGAMLILLNENLQHRNISATEFCNRLAAYIKTETNPLLYSRAIGYISSAVAKFDIDEIEELEKSILSLTNSENKAHNIQAFRTYTSIAQSEEAIDYLYNIWKSNISPKNLKLSESDFTSLSYKLALHRENKYNYIIATQLERIDNEDRKAAYRFITPSLSPDKAVRDSTFNSLLEATNRRIEPWASASLRNLNNKTRQSDALEYILPALEELKEVQQTGDIFFPSAWLSALLSGHQSSQSKEIVSKFLESNPDYPAMLRNKILQNSH